MDLRTDNNRLNNNAVSNPSTEKPSTNLSAKRIIDALIINKNKPRVSMVIGSVSMTNKGFTTVFRTEITTATIMAIK